MMRISLLMIFSTCCFSMALAQTQVVSTFKNGTGFFVKKMTVNAQDGSYMLTQIPQATFGTLWFDAPNNSFKSITAEIGDIKENQPVKSLEDLIRANQGKRANLKIRGEEESHTGLIEKVEGDLLIFKTDKGQWLSTSIGAIYIVQLIEKPNTELERTQSKRVIDMRFANKNANQTLEMMYLQKGISWVPSYLIDINAENKAKLILRSTLLNDAEDLKNATVNFVVGIPNFAYSYLTSPLSSTEGVMQFINTLNGQSNYSGQSLSRADITSQSMSNMMIVDEDSGDDTSLVPLEGQQVGDLYFYTAKDVNLPQGGRGFYDVLEADLEFEHLYKVTLNANSTYSVGYQNSYSFEQSRNLVIHSIRFKNTSKYPFTTGTAMVTETKDGIAQALSQDKLNYVPVGGTTKLKLTVAPNILVEDSEREISRESLSKQIDDYNYDLIQVEAKVKVHNYQDKEISLNICRNITGNTKKSNEEWEVKKLLSNKSGLNSSNDLEWEITIPAGKTKEIIYSYEIYVRR